MHTHSPPSSDRRQGFHGSSKEGRKEGRKEFRSFCKQKTEERKKWRKKEREAGLLSMKADMMMKMDRLRIDDDHVHHESCLYIAHSGGTAEEDDDEAQEFLKEYKH